MRSFHVAALFIAATIASPVGEGLFARDDSCKPIKRACRPEQRHAAKYCTSLLSLDTKTAVTSTATVATITLYSTTITLSEGTSTVTPTCTPPGGGEGAPALKRGVKAQPTCLTAYVDDAGLSSACSCLAHTREWDQVKVFKTTATVTTASTSIEPTATVYAPFVAPTTFKLLDPIRSETDAYAHNGYNNPANDPWLIFNTNNATADTFTIDTDSHLVITSQGAYKDMIAYQWQNWDVSPVYFGNAEDVSASLANENDSSWQIATTCTIQADDAENDGVTCSLQCTSQKGYTTNYDVWDGQWAIAPVIEGWPTFTPFVVQA